jgi:hypothetical protein
MTRAIENECEFTQEQPHEWLCTTHDVLVIASADEPVYCPTAAACILPVMAPRTRATPEQVAAELAAEGRYVDNDYRVRRRLPRDDRNRARAFAAAALTRANLLRAQRRIDAELERRKDAEA